MQQFLKPTNQRNKKKKLKPLNTAAEVNYIK